MGGSDTVQQLVCARLASPLAPMANSVPPPQEKPFCLIWSGGWVGQGPTHRRTPNASNSMQHADDMYPIHTRQQPLQTRQHHPTALFCASAFQS